ncbi:hypothetical protein E2C01_089678 [Portunus trituberculatus]|uniref:Uncharacterized protein n=1 Tax=Portunus trituberculatus TaxID=210409 RepID=A0A5B7JN37_PORTR|nr:hypothetical protein [Portunus trituberculatus]
MTCGVRAPRLIHPSFRLGLQREADEANFFRGRVGTFCCPASRADVHSFDPQWRRITLLLYRALRKACFPTTTIFKGHRDYSPGSPDDLSC